MGDDDQEAQDRVPPYGSRKGPLRPEQPEFCSHLPLGPLSLSNEQPAQPHVQPWLQPLRGWPWSWLLLSQYSKKCEDSELRLVGNLF